MLVTCVCLHATASIHREVLDGLGQPTVQCEVTTSFGTPGLGRGLVMAAGTTTTTRGRCGLCVLGTGKFIGIASNRRKDGAVYSPNCRAHSLDGDGGRQVCGVVVQSLLRLYLAQSVAQLAGWLAGWLAG